LHTGTASSLEEETRRGGSMDARGEEERGRAARMYRISTAGPTQMNQNEATPHTFSTRQPRLMATSAARTNECSPLAPRAVGSPGRDAPRTPAQPPHRGSTARGASGLHWATRYTTAGSSS